MSFSDVVSGERWQAEPAIRYNMVNQLLRSYADNRMEYPVVPDYCTVDLVNLSDRVIEPFTAVAVREADFSSLPEELQARFSGYCLVGGVPAEDDLSNWGIALMQINPGESGSMAVAGVVPAWFSGEGGKVTPSAAGLVAGKFGDGRIIAWPEKDSAGEDYPGIIVLGGGGGAPPADDYMGQFKITALSPTQASITFPGSTTYCGLTDVPGCEQVPPAEVSVPEGQQNIYIAFKFESPGQYSCWFAAGTNPPADADLFQLLGTFNNGYVVQGVNITNGRLTFGNDWYL